MTRDSDIDEIYVMIDYLMGENKLEIIDFIIKHIDLNSWGQSGDKIDLALSFLVSTLPVKNKLKERARFIRYIEEFAPLDEVDELLMGLI